VAASARAIEDGDTVAMFPQGTTLGASDRPWQRGAARLALTTGAPLIPVAIVGAADVLRPGTKLPRSARVRVRIGRPIHVERASSTIPVTRELTERVRAAVEALARA
jgi:1-acyl-sn-glycerol-3-phosphate acyltransferase